MKIELPNRWLFETDLNVRITDLNYGNHLANQNMLSFAHEARVRFYKHFGFAESDFGGCSLIQADAAVIYKNESFYGDKLSVRVSAIQAGMSSFNVFYLIVNQKDQTIAEMRTSMVCFDYEIRKPVRIPEEVLNSGIFID